MDLILHCDATTAVMILFAYLLSYLPFVLLYFAGGNFESILTIRWFVVIVIFSSVSVSLDN